MVYPENQDSLEYLHPHCAMYLHLHPVNLVHLAHQEPQVYKEHQDNLVMMGIPDDKEIRQDKDQLDQKDLQVHLDNLDEMDLPDNLVNQLKDRYLLKMTIFFKLIFLATHPW